MSTSKRKTRGKVKATKKKRRKKVRKMKRMRKGRMMTKRRMKKKMLLKGRVLTAAEYICGVGVGVRKKKEVKKKEEDKKEEKKTGKVINRLVRNAKMTPDEAKAAALQQDEPKKQRAKTTHDYAKLSGTNFRTKN